MSDVYIKTNLSQYMDLLRLAFAFIAAAEPTRVLAKRKVPSVPIDDYN